nr:MAG TPA: tail tape measure protein [Caudoviricetes sp.]
MNNDNGSIDFEARLRLEKLEEGVKEMEKMLNDSMKSSQKETDKLQQSINNLTKGAMAFFTISKAYEFSQKIIAVRSQFQQLEIAFGTMLKSKEKANALMAQMTDLAAKTPFGLQEVSEGAKRLLAFQVPAEEVTETLRRMGDVAAGLGVPMGQLIHVYGQVKAQGKLMTNDLYQFMNAGIPIIAELSKVVGKSETEIKDMVSAGKIGFPEVQAVIKGMTDEGGLFYNLMAEQSKTLSGQLSNLEDNFDNMLNEIGKATEGIASGAISSVAFLVENYQTLGKVIAGLIATYGAYRTAVLVNIALTKGWAVAAKEDAIAKGIQTIATNAATVATKALNAAMKANPYVLVATAVVGLGAAIWALKDNTTAAEKAQQDYNNQKQQAIDWEQQHKQKIDDLIESATNQALADTERQKALIALQNEYPNIFAKYDIESLKLADILKLKQEIAQYDANEKRLNRANEYGKYQDFEKALNKAKTGKRTYDANKLKNSILDEEMTRVFGKSWIHNIDEVEKYIREKQKITKNDYKGDRVAAWSMNVKNLSEEEIKKELEHRQKLIADLQKQKKAGNKWASHGVNFDGDWFAFNEEELQTQSKTLQAQLDKLHEQTYEYKDLTKKYTQAVKDAEKALDTIKNGGKGKHTEEEFAKIIKEAEDNLKNAKKTLEDHKTSLSKSKGTKAAKTKTELPTFDYKKAAQEESRREQDFLFQKEQARINIMEDGAKKRLAIIQLDYDRQEEEIRRRTEDQMAAFIEQQKAQAEAEGKWKKGQAFNEDTPVINAHRAKLQTEEQQLLASNHDYMLYQQEQVYKELLEKYQTYTDQRKAIEEKYNADIAALQAKLGADAPQVKKAQDEKARELKKLDILYKKEGTAIAKLFENMRKKTVKEIRETIADAEKEIDQLASMLDMGDKDNVDYIQNLKQQLEQARDTADRSDTTFNRLGKNIQALFKFKPNTIEWKDALQGVLSDAQSITGEFGQLGQEFEKLGQSTGNETLKRIGQTMQTVSNTLNRTLSMAQTGGSIGGGWGAVIGAVVGLVASGFEAQSKARMEHEKKLQEIAASKLAQQSEYNRLLWEERMLMKGNTSIFGTKEIANSLEYLKIYNDEWTKLQKNLFDDGNVRSYWDTRTAKDYNFYEEYKKIKGINDKFETSLDKINIVSGSHKEGFLWWSKSVNDYSKLTSMYPDLIKSNGEFNRELAESIVKTEQFGEGGKEALQEIINQYDRAQEAQKKFEEYIKNTFGELGKSITDNVYNALQKGENAFEGFAKSVGNVIGKLGKQMAYELFVAKPFEEFQKKLIKAGEESGNSENFANKSANLVSDFGNAMKGKVSEIETFLKQWNEMGKANGFDFLNEQRKAVEKGFTHMSQDTGEELNGRFTLMTALEKQMVDGVKEMHQSLVSLSERQLRHLANIDTNTYQLHQVKDDISGMKKDMAGVKRGIDELTTKGIKLKP